MMEFLVLQQNIAFLTATGLIAGFLLLEGLSFLVGLGLFSMLDSVIPDFEADIDADIDADLDAPASVSDGCDAAGALSWLGLGRVPLLVLLVVFLATFAISGYTLQYIKFHFSGTCFSVLLSSGIASVFAVNAIHYLGIFGKKMSMKNVSSAISVSTFVGRTATVTSGSAKGAPSRARFTDEFGTLHNVFVEPEVDDEQFEKGAQVILTGKHSPVVFLAKRAAVEQTLNA